MTWLITLSLSLFCWGVSHAQDASFAMRKAYLIDEAKRVHIDNIEDQSFAPYVGQLHLGFQPQPVWLRFDISPSESEQALDGDAAEANSLILRMGPYVTDQLVLYEPSGIGWSQQMLGDQILSGKRICPDDSHCFALKSKSNRPLTIYVKVLHQGVFTVRADVLTTAELPQVIAAGVSRISASMAIASTLFFLAFVLFLIERNWLLFTYCCFQLLVMVFMALTSGRLTQFFQHVSPLWTDELTHHFFNLRVLMFVLVGWAALAAYRPGKTYLRLVGVLVLASMGSSVAIALGNIQLGIVIYLSITGINLVVQFYGVLTTPHVTKKIRVLLSIGYVTYTLIFSMALLVIFGRSMPFDSVLLVSNFADWRLNGGPAGVIIFLIVILQQADRQLEASRVLGQLRVEAAQSLANQDKLAERLTLIDMLTHELKNPLGTIRFALASLKRSTPDAEASERVNRIDRSVERMNNLIEHVAHSNRIDRFEFREEKELIDAAEFIDELIAMYSEDDRFILQMEAGACFHSNRQMLSLVFENLISNAYKYDARLKPIQLDVFSRSDATVFRITNAIDPSIEPDPAQFFQRYYRHNNVQSMPGMGIGLSLVESAAKKIGAHVTFEIEAAQVAFTVEVPP